MTIRDVGRSGLRRATKSNFGRVSQSVSIIWNDALAAYREPVAAYRRRYGVI